MNLQIRKIVNDLKFTGTTDASREDLLQASLMLVQETRDLYAQQGRAVDALQREKESYEFARCNNWRDPRMG